MAVDFEASSSQYANAGSPAINTGALTLAAWMKPESDGTAILLGALKASYMLYWYRLGALTKWYVNYGNGASGSVVSSDAAGIGTGVWQHWLVTLNSGAGTFYVDNAAKGGSGGADIAAVTDGDLYLAARNNAGSPDSYFDGVMGGLAIWDKALNAAERSAVYASGYIFPRNWLNVAPANLLHLWLFDEGAGTTVKDWKGDNDGALVNNPARVAAPVVYPGVVRLVGPRLKLPDHRATFRGIGRGIARGVA